MRGHPAVHPLVTARQTDLRGVTHSEATNGPVHVYGVRDVCLTSQRLYLGAEVWGHVLSLSFRGVLQSTCTPQLRPCFSVPRGSICISLITRALLRELFNHLYLCLQKSPFRPSAHFKSWGVF